MEHEFQGFWIPASVVLDPNLTPAEKLLIAEIDGLSGPIHGPCHASADHLAKVLNSTSGNIRNMLSELTKRSYLMSLGSDGITTWRCVHPKYSSNLGKYAAWMEDKKLPEDVTHSLQGCHLEVTKLSPVADRGVSPGTDTENTSISIKKNIVRTRSRFFSLEEAKALPIPQSLQTPEFVSAWNEWLAGRFKHRAGKPSEQSQITNLRLCEQHSQKHGLAATVALVQRATAGSYQGMFFGDDRKFSTYSDRPKREEDCPVGEYYVDALGRRMLKRAGD